MPPSGCTRPTISRPEYSDRTFENASGRVTWQMTPRNKLSHVLGRPGVVPHVHRRDAGPRRSRRGFRRKPWGSSAGRSTSRRRHGRRPSRAACSSRRVSAAPSSASATSNASRILRAISIRVVEQCANGCPANGNIPGLVYRSQDFSVAYTGSYLWKGSLSHVTGAHSLKIGFQHTLMTDDRTWMTNNQNLTTASTTACRTS